VNGTTTYYFYNDEGLTAEANSTGTITQSYGYTPNSTWGTDPLYMRVNGTYHYYLNDHLGTPQQLAMKNGAKTWSAIYEAFGKATVTSSTITNNLRFPGQYADSETGLHYNWNRMYDNQIGRYTKVDPIGLRGGINSYSYGLNNPNKYIDPNGEFLNPWGAAGAALLEIGSQVLIQYVQYNGRYDCIDIDWSDVGIAFIGGALFPGAGKAITDVIYPGKIRKARKVLKYQLKRTKAESRKVKLKNRIKYHESIISNVVGGAVAGQIIVRGSKYLLDDPSQNQKKTGCSCDN
jgi:RHS repeat-associated protein